MNLFDLFDFYQILITYSRRYFYQDGYQNDLMSAWSIVGVKQPLKPVQRVTLVCALALLFWWAGDICLNKQPTAKKYSNQTEVIERASS